VLSWPAPSVLASVAWPLLYMSLGSVVIAMLCWNEGNRRIGALNAMLFINFQPVVTFAVRFAEGSRVRLLELLGGIIVVAALVSNTLYLRSRAPVSEVSPTPARRRNPEASTNA